MVFAREHRWKEKKDAVSSGSGFFFLYCEGYTTTPPPHPLFDTVYNEALLFVIEGIVLKKILNNQSTDKTSKKDWAF